MVEKYYNIFSYSHSGFGWIIRFGPATLVLFLFIFSTTQSPESFLNAVASVGILLINEIFLSGKVTGIRPKYSVDKAGPTTQMMVFAARLAFEKAESSFEIANTISAKKEIKFFKSKIGEFELIEASVTKEELLTQAHELAKFVKGKYITEIDLFASYLLLSEDHTKFLAAHDLLNEDIVNIAYWTRKRFKIDHFDRRRIKFSGVGVFDSLVNGWDFEIKKYTLDLTSSVFASNFPPRITGHDKEYGQLTVALSKAKNTNAILVGEAGVGKASIVEYLAYESFVGEVPKHLKNRRVYELLVDRLLSGVSTKGELEARLSLLLSDLSHSNVILFVQNIESIFGGGGFDFDISGVLAEYLNSQNLTIIGSTTQAGYDTYIRDKASINDVLEIINVDEFDTARTLLLLSEMAEAFERQSKVNILYSALKSAVVLSKIYYPARYNPGASVSLLDEVISSVKLANKEQITAEDVEALVQGKTHLVLEEPSDEEKEKLLNLEEKIGERIVGQKEAVTAVADAMRRVRAGFDNKNRPVATFLFLGPTGVGKTETAKSLAAEYFGDENQMIRLDMSELQNSSAISRLIGSASEHHSEHSLTDEIAQKPFSLVLLDEFEKADRDILNIFLSIFDEGKVTDARGNSVSFNHAIIIATSNAGSELIREKGNIDKKELVDTLLKNNIFSPELINRFDEVVLFRQLALDEVVQIAKIMLSATTKKMADDNIEVEFDDKAVKKIADESFDLEFGARNIRRFIEENVEQYISKLILEDKIKKGDKIKISVDEGNNFTSFNL